MTETDIANQALSRLGEPRISDIDENSPAALSCRVHLETVRDALLRSHPWNFATARAACSATDAPAWGWDYAYTLPDGFLRLLTFNGRQAKLVAGEYIIEGSKILTDEDVCKITYVQRVTDPTLFDPSFVEVLVFRLASAIAIDVTSSQEKRNEMEALAKDRLRDASYNDAVENKVTVLSPIISRQMGTCWDNCYNTGTTE